MRILLFLLFFTAYSTLSKPAQIDQLITLLPFEKSLNKNDNTEKVKPHEGVHLKESEIREGIRYLKGSDTPYTGKVFRLYKNGQKDYEANFKDGKHEGLRLSWYENGQKLSEQNYKDGKLDGLEIWWHEDGQKRKEINYKDRKKDGLEIWWHNGQKSWEASYKDDKQDGLEIWWHENGQKYRERNWKDGKVISRWKYFEKEGEKAKEIKQQQEAARAKIREQMLKARSGRRVNLPPPGINKGNADNSQNEVKKQKGIKFDELEQREGVHYLKGSDKPYKGKFFSLYKNGQKKIEANMKDGKINGLAFGWHENGKKMQEVKWNEGKAEGSATWWYESGQKKLSGTFKEGKRHGLWTWWDEKGQKQNELRYVKGEEVFEGVNIDELELRDIGSEIFYLKGSDTPYTGKSYELTWHGDGPKKIEGTFKNGKPDGLWVFYYSNGQLEAKSHYKDGKIDGSHVMWHPNGQRWSERNWKNGVKDGPWMYWHENGQKESEKNFKTGKLVEGSAKYWNSKGEPVDSLEEARK